MPRQIDQDIDAVGPDQVCQRLVIQLGEAGIAPLVDDATQPFIESVLALRRLVGEYLQLVRIEVFQHVLQEKPNRMLPQIT